MRQTKNPHGGLLCRRPRLLLPGFLLVVAVFVCRDPAEAQAPRDPVKLFQDFLRSDKDGTNDEALKLRKDNLAAASKNLRFLGEIAQVLLLPDWKTQDNPVRESLAQEFEDGVTKILESGDPARQLGAVMLVRETANSARTSSTGAGVYVRNRFRAFGPKMVAVINDPKTRNDVREEAIATLGQIEAPPELAVPVFDKFLQSKATGPDADRLRRRAAQALVDLQTAAATPIKQGDVLELDQIKDRLIKTGTFVVASALHGLRSPDLAVRRACTTACRNAANTAVDSIRIPYKSDELPSPQRMVLTDKEEKDVLRSNEEAKRARERVETLMKAFTDGARPADSVIGVLAQVAAEPPRGPRGTPRDEDESLAVRVDARRTLEDLAFARQRLVRLFASLHPAKGKVPEDELLAPLAATLRATVPSARVGLFDRDPPARQAAIHALETMGNDGAPAIPDMARVLTDPSMTKFMRWSAARTLAALAPADSAALQKMAPEARAALPQAVQGLSELTQYMRYDLDVRLAALDALEHYAPLLKDMDQATRDKVILYLGNAAFRGDAEPRVAAMKALQAAGVLAGPTLPAVARNLSEFYSRTLPTAVSGPPAFLGSMGMAEVNPNVRQTSCETLGRLAPLVLAAERDPVVRQRRQDAIIGWLRPALDDSEPEVRRAASDALLRVTGK
jgi:hypothetical protein